MSTRRMAPRAREVAFLGACLLLVSSIVPGVLRGEVLSQGQLLFRYAPWQRHAPPGLPSVNTFLVDPPTVFYPFVQYAAGEVRHFRLPTWSPGLYAGHPFLASFQAAVFSPFTAIAYAVPLPQATVFVALAPLLVGAFGMRRLVRSWGLVEGAAWFAGLAWLLNGFAVVWFEHPLTAVACWLPWLMLVGERVVDEPGARRVACLAVTVALAIVAGHPETVLKVFLFTGAWTMCRAWRRPAVAWRAMIAGYAAGLVLASIQVLPFAEYLSVSEALARRGTTVRNEFFNPVETLITAIVPDFFGNPASGAFLARVNRFGVASNYGEQQVYAGAVTLLVAAIGIAAYWRERSVRVAAACWLAALALVYGVPGVIDVVSHLPIVRVSILTRFGLVAIACAIVLAAHGVDALVRAQAGVESAVFTRRVTRVIGTTLGGLVLCVVIAHVALRSPLEAAGVAGHSFRATLAAAVVLCTAALLAWLRLHGRLAAAPFAVALCGLLACELAVQAHGFHPTIAPGDVMPPLPEVEAVRHDRGLYRVYGWDTTLLPNTAMVYGLQDARGWDGVQPARYTRLLDLGYLRQAAEPVRHLADPLLLDVLNVKYVFVPPGLSLPPPRYEPVSGTSGAVYRNTRAQPRAFLVSGYEVMTDRQMEGALHAGRIDLGQVALLERELPADERPESAPPDMRGSANVTRYEDTLLEVQTDAPGPRLLVLSEAHYPGWRARIDGQPATLYRADYALRAVAVPAGRHIVRFEYRPWTVSAGGAASLAQAAVLFVAVLSGRRRSVS